MRVRPIKIGYDNTSDQIDNIVNTGNFDKSIS